MYVQGGTEQQLFPSSTFVIEIASPEPDETSLRTERPARNGGHLNYTY